VGSETALPLSNSTGTYTCSPTCVPPVTPPFGYDRLPTRNSRKQRVGRHILSATTLNLVHPSILPSIHPLIHLHYIGHSSLISIMPLPETMRGVVLKGAFNVKVERRPVPRVEKDTDAVMRVHLAGLCGGSSGLPGENVL
jgi:hypothetical protein